MLVAMLLYSPIRFYYNICKRCLPANASHLDINVCMNTASNAVCIAFLILFACLVYKYMHARVPMRGSSSDEAKRSTSYGVSPPSLPQTPAPAHAHAKDPKQAPEQAPAPVSPVPAAPAAPPASSGPLSSRRSPVPDGRRPRPVHNHARTHTRDDRCCAGGVTVTKSEGQCDPRPPFPSSSPSPSPPTHPVNVSHSHNNCSYGAAVFGLTGTAVFGDTGALRPRVRENKRRAVAEDRKTEEQEGAAALVDEDEDEEEEEEE